MTTQMQTQGATALLFKGLLRPVLVSAVFFMLLTGLAYPLVTTGLANLLFPFQAQGSLVQRDGRVVGSALIGQAFDRPEYFQGRPSMTLGSDPLDPSKSVPQPYNAGASGASNLGPTSQKLVDSVAARVSAYRQLNGLAADMPVPVDAVTASASGLDPHISLANARLQLNRVARQRQMAAVDVLMLLQAHSESRTFGLLGEPRVNVLQLNLALDAQAPLHSSPVAASE
ncbi:K+-transporting ATPase ATPase C chain [Pseudomonas protegens]|uniref:Potassium-transporting ATPase KdpC subunit n=1 Tax=Pseudomonas protegens (strain DSM 19095 / LMG 27888 / CFBP 6595 / CHA0) TaxID=1124983 RepID=A0A2C9ERU1_PSEPH|nr:MULTISPECIES: potassium-transporting ATPase subunit KdpC [Pseudomonas]BCQ64182.1 potassium-transporting ATPase KdpC subunit [Pseudomonas sp. Boi14]GED74917.1 potassium-transporting ATPase KdpC subunit [Pseudomonas fluorescens]AGL86394.1 potassium-transporting ATPase C chain KdpC [Pseudomonas protegens CHA0]APC22009.1 potassium-transporting ATPase subunit C [Pseudomonas protegens]AQT11513.1 K+-transporting ATPase subunit C [Pseudomonas protegens]